jgi:hypothetical protein
MIVLGDNREGALKKSQPGQKVNGFILFALKVRL